MILVRFTGGLGNQLFQYALGTALAQRNKTVLKIDTSLLLDRSQPHEIVTHRNLDIDIFNVELNLASAREIEYFNGKSYTHLPGKLWNRIQWELGRKQKLVVEKGRRFSPAILNLTDSKCLVGAWQSEKYFLEAEDLLRKQLTFKEAFQTSALCMAQRIQECASVCVNVRRGDYVTSPVYRKTLGALSASYYH
ncbi:MAG TPA: alpha-1,2-fucosyltransferase, partial [Bacteroidia bacterium]|nr:alpha-1,2-fucosyltransferase [Bacteroidia bacterium]